MPELQSKLDQNYLYKHMHFAIKMTFSSLKDPPYGRAYRLGGPGSSKFAKKIKKYRENLAVSKRAVFDVFSNKKLQKWSVLSCMDRYDVF